ncbi:MAG: hypothetical protein VKP70_04945 [Cyanobacteriota bacterium]|nr:hypothetical protein [Cyanobacteriota bacterium]
MTPPLERLELAVVPAPGPLLPQIRRALADHLGPNGEALRWAITGLAAPDGPSAPPRLMLEAVVLHQPR